MASAEDVFDPPAALVKQALPRRDQSPVVRKVPAAAAGEAERIVDGLRERIVAVLRHDATAPSLARAGERFLAGEADPLGAAAVLVSVYGNIVYHDETTPTTLLRGWSIRHGLPLVAAAGVAFGGVGWREYRAGAGGRALGFVADGATPINRWSHAGFPELDDLRAALAGADDDTYAAAVAAMAACRTDDHAKAVSAFLAPTEADWVADLDRLPPFPEHWLFAAASNDPDQLAARFATLSLYHRNAGMLRALATMFRNLGPRATRPLVAALGRADAASRKRVLAMLAAVPTDEAFTALLTRMDEPKVRPALLDAMRAFPRRATRLLSDALAGPGPVADLLTAHLLSFPELATTVVPELPRRDEVLALLGPATSLPDATPDLLPAVLATPPWTRPAPARTPVVLTGVTAPPTRIVWAEGEQAAWLALRGVFDRYIRGREVDWSAEVAKRVGWRELLCAPAELVEPLVAQANPPSNSRMEDACKALLARFGETALAAVSRGRAPAALAPVLSADTAGTMAAGLGDKRRTMRVIAQAWFARHGLAAVPYLLPAATGKPGAARSAAEHALRTLAATHGSDRLVAEAGAAADAVREILATDLLTPAALPPAPGAWLSVAALPRILLRDKEFTLPLDAVGHLVTMLALSTPDQAYGGVALVRDACDRESLAEFGWALFEQWRAAGMPPKDAWALTSLGWLGNDETVRRLTPVIRAWPGQSAHQKAVAGLDVLGEIGTDVALLHLNGIATKVKFAGLKTRAREKIELVAANLGLTSAQLADRLVPDLGLDENGTLVLDYGPRRFVVGFDERLTPFVRDEDGTPRKTLPKPGAHDDADLAPAAHQRFGALKKDVRTLAAGELIRLEHAMVTGRRWRAGDFRTFLVGHPLLIHVVRRLVWGVFDGDTMTGSFRVAEDRTYADVHDETLHLADDALVGVAHPVQLEETVTGWREVFDDYEILQPFRQLTRPVHTLTGEDQLTVFLGTKIPTTGFLGLTRFGWQRGTPQDAGVEDEMTKPVPGGRVVLEFEDGIAVGAPDAIPDQAIRSVYFADAGGRPRPLAELDAVSASELLMDLTDLTS